LEVKHQQLVR
jgi:hypothetical protein